MIDHASDPKIEVPVVFEKHNQVIGFIDIYPSELTNPIRLMCAKRDLISTKFSPIDCMENTSIHYIYLELGKSGHRRSYDNRYFVAPVLMVKEKDLDDLQFVRNFKFFAEKFGREYPTYDEYCKVNQNLTGKKTWLANIISVIFRSRVVQVIKNDFWKKVTP